MTPVMRARLQSAVDYVLAAVSAGTGAKEIIGVLVADHRAFYRTGNTNELRVAGVTATCTWAGTDVLLDRWRGNAVTRLITAAANG